MKKAIIKGEKDNVAILLQDAKLGEEVAIYNKDLKLEYNLIAKTDLPYGNKIAIKEIIKKEIIYKGNYPIGSALKNITIGELVHVHNAQSDKINFPQSIINEILKQMNINGI
ncbi:MAG: SAF domain-containing protein [Peptostreptococcaceae bacterium]|nr:SAF domain-containing protein [Peptostreptococcaceae bacterium]